MKSHTRPIIDFVPAKVLSKIFLDVELEHNDTDFVTQSAFLCACQGKSTSIGSHLGSVCKRWRTVTLDTPALWASLHISVIPGWNRDPFRLLNRVMIHLERSGNAPLSIHLTVANTDLVMQAIVGQAVNAPVELRAWCMLIKTLFNHSDRIHRLAFVLGGISGDDPSAAFILSTFRHSFTSLRHLSLSTPQSPHEVLDLSIFPIHSFTLHQPCRSDNFFRWHTLPLSQITELGLLDVTPQVLLMFLPRFPNLMVAKLRICYSHSPHSDLSRATRLLLPHLHTLEIRYIDEWESDDLFLALEILVLPALTHFSLIVKEDSSVCMFVQQRSVYPAMQHLLEHVRVLRMTRVPFDICHIPQLLAKLRSVAELAITQLQVGSIPAAASISTTVLKELSKEGIVPQLRSLTIVVPKEPEDGLLEKMRESRSDVLRSVDIKVQMDDKYRLGMMVVQNMAEEFVP